MKYTIKEFADIIRKKYPGDYDNISDLELVTAWVKKYPDYLEVVDIVIDDNKNKFRSGIKGKVNELDSYPYCVRFAEPTKNAKGQWYIVGVGDYAGLYFYNNGKYLDKDGKVKNYKCDGENVILDQTPTTSQPTPPATTGATTPPGFTPSPATSDDIKNGKLVKFGMTGNIVTEIQKLLIQKGYTSISKNGEPDGIFGIRTYNSVKKFQELNGLKPDGVVGPLTYGKLTDANAVKYDGSPMSTTSPTRRSSSSSNQEPITECSDFPFKRGCKNPKIAEMRKKLIGDNKDVYDQDLYNAIKEDLKLGDKRITQDIYNKIMGK